MNLSELCQLSDEWKDAPLAIASVSGKPLPVCRVSLHRDSSGRRVVMIHDEELPWPPLPLNVKGPPKNSENL